MTTGTHIDLDGAWDPAHLPANIRTIDARPLGPDLRYMASEKTIEHAMNSLHEQLADARFILYGSGDFHYLAAWWLRRALTQNPGPLTLISFDNHPDWDIRPPKWACGGWINRALEMEGVTKASVWGCGNFELGFPGRIFRNRAALRSKRLEVHGWAERQNVPTAAKFSCMTRTDWRDRFSQFAATLNSQRLYITIDMDALAEQFAVTNWENGLFTPDDIVWAIAKLRENSTLIAGDICGAYSQPTYARRFQRFAGKWDHPTLLEAGRADKARTINHQTLATLWPALLGNSIDPA